ncbi:MAG: twin-arginine translocation signal domain-containing protein [Halobacteriaceae archaeon]
MPTDRTPDGSSRRNFLRAALAIGGSGALSACLNRETAGEAPTATEKQREFPQGPDDLSNLPESQHYWQDYIRHSRLGNTLFPQMQVLLFLNYEGEGLPTDEERERVETALRTLEHAYVRGTGGAESALIHRGLLFTVSYSPSYFDRFDEPLPDGVDLQTPEAVMEQIGETDPTPDRYDAMVHLGSGYASVVMAAEQALFGELDELNGVPVEGTFEGVFEKAERRPGFFGNAQPAMRYDVDAIPEKAPLSMGFKAGFRDNLPPEERMNVGTGPFAEGTTEVVSHIDLDLERWYDENDVEDQVELLFSPEHSTDRVGELGENLAGHSGKTPETVDRIPEDAREKGRLGHGQKLAQARDDDFVPVILRRDFNDARAPGLHFDSWQSGISDFVETRQAMNATEWRDEVPEKQNGILSYMDVTSRATFLMPPRSLRALPTPGGEA